MIRVLALHGQALSGAAMGADLAHLAARGVPLVCPDAPHRCPEELVERMYALGALPGRDAAASDGATARRPTEHRAWWRTSEDGRTYDGWEATRDLVEPLLTPGPVGLVGFSQGAILATVLAALSEAGELPPLAFVVLIAGRTPRAERFAPLFARPLRTPSLHVWGDADHLVGTTSRELVERFDAATRSVATWPGGHAMPTGAAAATVARFVARHARRDAGASREPSGRSDLARSA